MLMLVSGKTYAIVIVYFNICTTLFQQFPIVFNKKYFKQVRQVYLIISPKKHCYISSIWLAVNEARISIKGKGLDTN